MNRAVACIHATPCPPGLAVPDVLIYCRHCGRDKVWHYCHYCCPDCGHGDGKPPEVWP